MQGASRMGLGKPDFPAAPLAAPLVLPALEAIGAGLVFVGSALVTAIAIVSDVPSHPTCVESHEPLSSCQQQERNPRPEKTDQQQLDDSNNKQISEAQDKRDRDAQKKQQVTPKEPPAMTEPQPVSVKVPKAKYPASAEHIEEAQANGHPQVLTIHRPGAKDRRKDAMKGKKPVNGNDRDEYPPAMTQEGGTGASVKPINPSDNRGAGSCIGKQCTGLADGTKIKIEVE